MKGARQEADRINKLLRAANLATLEVTPWADAVARGLVQETAQREDRKGKDQHFVVGLVEPRPVRRIPKGLSEHRKALERQTARSDALRKHLAGLGHTRREPRHAPRDAGGRQRPGPRHERRGAGTLGRGVPGLPQCRRRPSHRAADRDRDARLRATPLRPVERRGLGAHRAARPCSPGPEAKGFHLARTEDICAEAGLSAGTLFRHFPDKRSMIMAIADVEFERFRAEIEALATREGIAWLTRITAADLAQLLEPKGFDLGTDSWLELARDAKGGRRLLGVDLKLQRTLARQLARGQAEGWIRASLDCEGTAAVVLALFSGVRLDGEVGVTVNTKATARAMADLFRAAILP
ncbi:MAG: TetR/AcrR family transcriptional regulator [Burkholderiaceae bacterium]|nr:TetR/AcrR family transcriptional regulator [Burkholderiaceae bacterium]